MLRINFFSPLTFVTVTALASMGHEGGITPIKFQADFLPANHRTTDRYTKIYTCRVWGDAKSNRYFCFVPLKSTTPYAPSESVNTT